MKKIHGKTETYLKEKACRMQSDSISLCGEMADSFKRCEIDSRKAVNLLTSLAIVRFS